MSKINLTEMEDMPFNLSKNNADRFKKVRLEVIKLWHEYDDKTEKIGKQKVRGWAVKYPPHDDTHSQKIQKILKKLLPDEQVVDKAFSDDEKFLLLAAVWLHDVGMNPELLGNEKPTEECDKELRKVHNVRSAKWIKSHCAQLSLTEQECERLATIALLHRKAEKIPNDLDLKTRLIIAYLRLADALHIPNRAPLGELKTHLAYGMDAVSKFHWFKSFYVIDSEPSEEEFKITVKFKKPISWNGNPEEDMSPLVDVLNTELKDEIDSVKSILLEGKLRLGLPAYINIDSTFERTYMEEERISELYELLAIIELFNPIMTPNSGAVVDIVLNQIKRYADRNNQGVSIDRLKDYRLNTLKPLLDDRPCHVYIWKVCKKLKDMLNELDKNISNPKQIIPDQWRTYTIDDIQKVIKGLIDNRKALEKDLPSRVFSVITFRANDCILVYGYSSSVIMTLNALQPEVKNEITVYVCECSTKTKYRYDNRLIYSDGIKYFRELKGVGIKNVKYVVDLCASNLFSFKGITKVLFGANGIDKTTGEVAHGLGHLAIADMAASHKIPVFVITEARRIGDLKENPGHMREGPWYPTDILFDVIDVSNSYNPREERVPFKGLITNIITEKGVYPDKSLEEISREIDDI